jgi:hypothetical protein
MVSRSGYSPMVFASLRDADQISKLLEERALPETSGLTSNGLKCTLRGNAAP